MGLAPCHSARESHCRPEQMAAAQQLKAAARLVVCFEAKLVVRLEAQLGLPAADSARVLRLEDQYPCFPGLA